MVRVEIDSGEQAMAANNGRVRFKYDAAPDGSVLNLEFSLNGLPDIDITRERMHECGKTAGRGFRRIRGR